MAKAIPDVTMDPSLTKFATATVMHACVGQPTTHANMVSTSLANASVSAQIVLADDTSGRKATVPAKSSVTVTTNGTADHVALSDGTTLLAVTTCTPQALTTANPVSFPTWKWNIQDPT